VCYFYYIRYTTEITYHTKIPLGGLYAKLRKNYIFKLTTGRDSSHKTNNHTDRAVTLTDPKISFSKSTTPHDETRTYFDPN
jgi:hypothetical protein